MSHDHNTKTTLVKEIHPPRWPETCQAEVEEILKRYPEDREMSAILPLLHLSMREREGRFVALSDMEAIAEICGVSPAYVNSVCSFYSMYKRQPIGKYLLTVCGNMACHLIGGGAALIEHMEKSLGIKVGETTPDGLITLEVTGECVAACDLAPVIQVDVEYAVKMTPAKFDGLVAALRSGEGPDAFLEKLPLMNGESQAEWQGFAEAACACGAPAETESGATTEAATESETAPEAQAPATADAQSEAAPEAEPEPTAEAKGE